MRVFITSHNGRFGGGISVARNLIAAFGRVAPENEYFVTVPPELGYEESCSAATKCQCLAYRHSGTVRRWRWETFSLPAIACGFQPDVVFNMANRGFLSPPAPQATLIQDPHLLYPFSQFGRISLRQRLTFAYHRRHLRRSLRATGLVFCQTEAARERFRAMYGDAVRVALCPNQFSLYASRPADDIEEPERLQPYRDKFKLFVLTRHYPHKNLEIIPEVLRRYRRELADVAVVLTIYPEESPRARELLETVRAEGLDGNIATVGALPQDQLAAHYTHTDALFLPTLLESFSGTYVEAMTYGRPILTSDMDFARTVCGDAAEYFDPFDPASICRAILKVKNDAALRERLVEAGRKRHQDRSLTWDEIGLGVIRELESLAQSGGASVREERMGGEGLESPRRPDGREPSP